MLCYGQNTSSAEYRDTPGNPIAISDDESVELEEVNQEIAVNEPTLGEVEEAVKKLRSGKALGLDNITAELFKTNEEENTWATIEGLEV